MRCKTCALSLVRVTALSCCCRGSNARTHMRAQARAHTDTPACILACLHPLAFKPLPCVSTCYRSLSPSLLRQREAAEDGQPPQQPHRRGASPSTSLHPSNPKRAFARLHPPELVSLGWQGDSRLIVHTIAVALGARRGVVGSKRRRARHLDVKVRFINEASRLCGVSVSSVADAGGRHVIVIFAAVA